MNEENEEPVDRVEFAVCTHDTATTNDTCEDCMDRVRLHMDYTKAVRRIRYLESGLGYILGRGYTGAEAVAKEILDGRAKHGQYNYAAGVTAKG